MNVKQSLMRGSIVDNVPPNPDMAEAQIDEDALVRAERLLKNSQNAIKNLTAELSDKDDQLSANANEVQRQAKVIGVLRQELDIAQNDIENLKNSTSWKLTGPVRAVRKVINRILGR